jgi:hypothetical protein
LLEWLCSVGLPLSGKCPPGANNTGKSEKMRRVNAMSTEVLDNGFFAQTAVGIYSRSVFA